MDFMTGCNYWASNAGADMWRNWDADTVRKDLESLSGYGIDYLRVFINWRDFQPVKPAYRGGGVLKKYVNEDDSEPTNIWYLDETCMKNFGTFCDICEEYGMKMIVGLVTGWMSGKLFIPSALYGKSLLTDPTALFFEQKLVQGIVRNFKDKKAIFAWNLGNECDTLPDINVCKPSEQAEAAAMWAQVITNAIKAEDASRPVVSGLTSPSDPDRRMAPWNPQLHGQTVDIMTVHPYAYFRPHCSDDFFRSVRATMHPVAIARLVGDISGKPVLVEETGTLSKSVCCDEVSADFMRAALFSNWANGNMGLLWWCACDQTNLSTAPYTWDMLERELGMTDGEGKPKEYLKAMGEFSEFVKNLPFKLPEAEKDVVIIVPSGLNRADVWGRVFPSYIMAKQAKLNPSFAYCEGKIPKSGAYILPCVNASVPPETYFELRKRVSEGADIFISNDGGFLQDFKGFTGVEFIDSAKSVKNVNFDFKGKHFSYKTERIYKSRQAGAEILARDEEGNPIFTVNAFGKGNVYFLNLPLEKDKSAGFDMFSDGGEIFYAEAFGKIIGAHAARCEAADMDMTVHYESENSAYLVIVNHSDKTENPGLVPADGWEIAEIYRGKRDKIKPFDAFAAKIIRQNV